MKKIFLIMAFLFSIVLNATASFDGPCIVYTLEKVEEGDGVIHIAPDGFYLYPHVFYDNWPGNPEGVLGVMLDHLKSFKPKLYKNVELTNVTPEEKFPIRKVIVKVASKNEAEFKTIMAELIYSFEFYNLDSRGPVTIEFHFTDTKLEKKFGGRGFGKKDVHFPVFLLKPPPSK